MTYYDEIAPGYDELHFEEQKCKAEIILKELSLKKTDTLLDVGCGTGKITALFPCNAQGIDPAAELVKQSPVPAQVGKAESLPFPDKSFDVVISLTAVQNFDDIDKGIAEIARVAKRDVVITCLKKSKKLPDVERTIQKHLTVRKRIEEQHDIIYFCSP
ncbi:methyltransferase domain-containing protein [Candidatus Woesearchaeota archaeon]|nr:MAG: methyltransferase domain-containing protein [Candidatus Woesearchaeota archaeon]